MNSGKNCFTIESETGFLSGLAGWILQNYSGHDYMKMLVLLPNRRSCRSLREEFLKISGGKPMFLPRIQPIGEVENEIFIDSINSINSIELQPVDAVRRQFLLMKLVMEFQKKNSGGIIPAQIAELAGQLSEFIDEINREELEFSNIESLVPDNLAKHWQDILNFLSIILHKWPEVLRGENIDDIVTHRNKVLNLLADSWEQSPPDYHIIAAGSTGSQPAVARLLKTISCLPHGMVVLPFLDRDMDDKNWQEIGVTHPQYALKKLLEKLGINRKSIQNLAVDFSNFIDKNNCEILSDYNIRSRENYLRAIFTPPLLTSNWADIELPDGEGLKNISIIEAENLAEEAMVIAALMREVLETPGKTAALVTSDRVLARIVSSKLQRFGVMVDDSAGKPLLTSPQASFLRLVADMVANKFTPYSLLAVLRHPLTAAGVEPEKCRRISRELEINFLRGVQREDGISSLVKAILSDPKSSDELKEIIVDMEEKSAPFSALFVPHFNAGFKDMLDAHIKFAQWLCGSDTKSGEERLWASDSGNALAEVIAKWSLYSEIIPKFDPVFYPAFFDSLLSGEMYHTRYGLHPRLHILSPMESRLQRYDKVIIGGLNEGSWPKASQNDPWMSRPQREEFGLPPREKLIGQSAHDFMMLMLSSEVVLTRAVKVDGTPSIASRWLVRMKVFLQGRVPQIFSKINKNNYAAVIKSVLEKPSSGVNVISSPSFAPPVSVRPRKLRVTAIDSWINAPYTIYARYILGLKKMDELSREPNALDFGNIIHKAMENFTNSGVNIFSDDAYNKILESGKFAFNSFIDKPAVYCLWWPRFVSMASWFVEEERNRSKGIENIYSEVQAFWNFEVSGNDFTITTRIDRLEKLNAGGYCLVDYKTGNMPSNKDVNNGLANQLPLEALIIQNGDASGVGKGEVVKMEYWKLSGDENKCEVKNIKADIYEAEERLKNLIAEFDNEEKAYDVLQGGADKYNDYEHLIRRKEWEVV